VDITVANEVQCSKMFSHASWKFKHTVYLHGPINGQVLQQVEAQSDFGVMISNNLKASDQCVKSYAKASRVLGMIGRNIRYKSPDVMLRLYKSMVSPHVEYCTVAWSPH